MGDNFSQQTLSLWWGILLHKTCLTSLSVSLMTSYDSSLVFWSRAWILKISVLTCGSFWDCVEVIQVLTVKKVKSVFLCGGEDLQKGINCLRFQILGVIETKVADGLLEERRLVWSSSRELVWGIGGGWTVTKGDKDSRRDQKYPWLRADPCHLLPLRDLHMFLERSELSSLPAHHLQAVLFCHLTF